MPAKVFENYLRSQGLRLTRERRLILEEAATCGGHFDPEGLVAALRAKGHRVSRASVYRTLPLLLGAGLIGQVESADRVMRYELTHGRKHHDHMLCLTCGRVIEFYSEALEQLQDRICKREGFTGSGHMLEIRGQCKECRKRKG